MQKNAKFSSAGGSALLAPPPIANLPPHLRISGYAPGSIFDEDLFFNLHLNSGEKSVPFLKTFYFALHLVCSPEKNGGRGSSPPRLKIGQNWGKIANYPPQCSTKICTPGRSSTKFNPMQSASMKTNKNLTNRTPTTRIVIKVNMDQIKRADW